MAKDAVDAAVHGMQRRVPGVVHRRASPLRRAPTATSPRGTPRELAAGRTGLRRRQVEHLLSRYGTLIAELLDLIAERPRAGRAARRRARTTSRRRPATPPRTRARCTWTTSSPGAPASRSRPTTAATPRPRRWPSWSPPSSAGTRDDVAREVEHYRARVAGRARVPAPAGRPHRRRRPARRTGRAGGRQRPGLTRPSAATDRPPLAATARRSARPPAGRGAPWLALKPGRLAG